MSNKSVVLLIHGMGTHKKGQITKDFKKAVSNQASHFGIDPSSFIQKVDYREFNYSDYLDLVRQQFADNSDARARGFKILAGKGFDDNLINQLSSFESKFGKDEFYYTHWLDVILYGTMYFGEKIRIDFVKQFEALGKKYKHRNIHVISHSLGTSVVHDALAKYYRINSDPFDNIADLKTGDFNVASYWTFANVSRMVNLLNGLTDPNHSTVVTGNEGCTRNFVNIRHQYDPFTWFKTYNRNMKRKTTFINKTIRNVNTHDFYEYVTEPTVSRTIMQFIYGMEIDDAAFEAGKNSYKQGSLSDEAKKLKILVENARSSPSIDDLDKAMKKYKQIVAEIKSQTQS